jgi:hypothetical protein
VLSAQKKREPGIVESGKENRELLGQKKRIVGPEKEKEKEGCHPAKEKWCHWKKGVLRKALGICIHWRRVL